MFNDCEVKIIAVLDMPAVYWYGDADYDYWVSPDKKTLYCLIKQ